MDFYEQLNLMNERVASGDYPPLSGGYVGINIYSTNGNHFSDVLLRVHDYLSNLDGVEEIVYTPFEVRWSYNESTFSAKVKTHFLETFHLDLDILEGSAQDYLDLMSGMITDFLANGVIRLPNPEDVFDEDEWREAAIERMEGRWKAEAVAPAFLEELENI